MLRQIENLLPREIRARLSATEKVFVSSFLTAQAQKPFTEADLPDLVKRKFTERDGSRGNLVLVEVPLGDEIKDGDFLIGLVAKLRSISDSVRQGLAITGGRAVTADLYEAVKRDGPRAMLFALLSVIALVILLFRRPSAVFFVLLSLLLGVFWMAGVMLHFSWKINFLNFIAFPITFGIGIDYGVNLYQRYREEGPGKILDGIGTRRSRGAREPHDVDRLRLPPHREQPGFREFRQARGPGGSDLHRGCTSFLASAPASSRSAETMTFLSDWKNWWAGLPLWQRIAPAAFAFVYIPLIDFLGALRSDHWALTGAILLLSYGGPQGRRVLRFALPLLLTGIIYDSQRFYSDYIRGPIHIREPCPSSISASLGSTANGRLTPNEWWQLHTHPVLDLITGFFYLTFIAMFLAGKAAIWSFWPLKNGRHPDHWKPMWAFLWVNLLGYTTYYWYAAAPPFLVHGSVRHRPTSAHGHSSESGRMPPIR